MSSQGQTISQRCYVRFHDPTQHVDLRGSAERRSRGKLWRRHYWAEFNGFNSAFLDPWGNTMILWTKGGSELVVPEGWTRE